MTRPMPEPPECTCIGRGSGCLTCLDTIGYDLEAICPTCPVHAGPSYSETKRLTDAECAAHYWQAFCYRARALAEIINLPPHEARRIVKESDAWHRFDTHRHALEES